MISKLSIARFKAIRYATFHLQALNLLAGINGMGKSTCLQSLLLLRQSWLARTLPSQGLLLRGNFVDLGRGQDVLHQFVDDETIEFKVGTSDGEATWSFDVATKRGLDHDMLALRSFSQTYSQDASLTPKAYEHPPFSPGFRYLSAERIRPEAAYETSLYAVRELDELGPHGEFSVHYLAEHQNRPVRIETMRHPSLTASQSDLLSNVRAWLRELSPGVSLSLQHYPGIGMSSVEYLYDTGPDKRFTNGILPPNIGFGIHYALPIIIAALSTKPGDVMLIENPESHLHPSGQARIGRLLAIAAAAGVQVFIETHSDHVLNGIRVAVKAGELPPGDVAIFSFHRETGDPSHDVRIVTPNIDRNGKVDQWPASFFDETEKLLFELI